MILSRKMAIRRAFAWPGLATTLFFLVILVLLVLPSRAARANLAFPDSLQILLPADRPDQIALATNFGLIISDDGGATWTWTCEQKETVAGFGYAVGPSPADRFYSLSTLAGLAFSDDSSCSWTLSGGTLDTLLAKDFFPDPTQASRVLAVASSSLPEMDSIYQLVLSHDGGQTFEPPIYTAPPTGTISGVECARSDPNVIYLALYTTTDSTPSFHPKLARSSDGGLTFATTDLEPALGPVQLRIIAVDPADPMTIFIRVIAVGSESVAISHDGGATWKTPISVGNGKISAFAQLASGTILVAAQANTYGFGYRSTDGGATFQPWVGVPHISALAERDGKLYVAAKNYTDFWAIGVSTDEGLTIQPLGAYDSVRAIRACAQVSCMDACDYQAGGGVWAPAVCTANSDGGTTPPPPPPKKSGCSCAAGGETAPPWASAAAVALAVAVAARRALKRRKRPAELS
jgi:MYXO-CTERM domain-containing protein